MAQSKRFRKVACQACIAALGLAFSAEGWTWAPTVAPRSRAAEGVRVSLMADASACQPGLVEDILNRWLDATKDSEFESEYVAIAFDELVDLVHALRDIAQDFCV